MLTQRKLEEIISFEFEKPAKGKLLDPAIIRAQGFVGMLLDELRHEIEDSCRYLSLLEFKKTKEISTANGDARHIFDAADTANRTLAEKQRQLESLYSRSTITR